MAPKTKTSAKKKGSLYDVHPSVQEIQDWLPTLPEKTGRSLEQWIALVKKSGPASTKERVEWLRKNHGLGWDTANYIVGSLDGGNTWDGDPESYLRSAEKYVEDMYAGGKSGLKPFHDRLLELGRKLAKDVRICPCKSIVPFYREHVIAQIKPSTRTRVDFGLALAKFKGKLPKRLVDTGGLAKKDRITHRFEITSVDQIDGEVERWLKTAYELDA